MNTKRLPHPLLWLVLMLSCVGTIYYLPLLESHIYFYENGERGGTQMTSAYAEKFFNQVLRQAKIPLAEKYNQPRQ